MQEVKNFKAIVSSNNLGAAAIEFFQKNKKTNMLNSFDWISAIETFQKDNKTSLFECLKATLPDFSRQENLKKVTSENITTPNIIDVGMDYLLENLSEEDWKKLKEIYEVYKNNHKI